MSVLTAPKAPAGLQLTRRAKAAIVVQFLLQEGADVPLSTLPEGLQDELTRQLGAMRYVDRETLRVVMDEFAEELDTIGLRFPGDIAGAVNALEGKVSPQLTRRIRKETGAKRSGDPWDRIGALAPEQLATFAAAESIEVAAVLISKLDVNKAAEMLGMIPGERARRITYAVSMTANVTPEAVRRIGESLAAQLDEEPAKAFDTPAVDRVGAILNYSAANTRDDVLEGLEAEDEAFANAVRRAIFTFANIPERVDPLDVPKISRDVPQDVIVTALAGSVGDSDKAAAEFILENMSRRMADAIRDEVADKGSVPTQDAEAAMSEIVTAIRDMAGADEIALKKPVSG